MYLEPLTDSAWLSVSGFAHLGRTRQGTLTEQGKWVKVTEDATDEVVEEIAEDGAEKPDFVVGVIGRKSGMSRVFTEDGEF